MGVDGGAINDPPDEQPGYVYMEGRRVAYAEHISNLELSVVEFTIAKAVLKLPSVLGTTVVQIVHFMRYAFHC